MSGEPSLAITAIIRDDLVADSCLIPMLEVVDQERTHGSEDYCDQPLTRHAGQPVRRYQRPMSAHFARAVAAFGRLQKSPYSSQHPPWMEDWVFLAGIWSKKQVTHEGQTYSGDVYATMAHDHLVRILAWDQKRSGCDWDVQILHRQHDGTIDGPRFDVDLGFWLIISQFRWTVVSRGLREPAEVCCA